MYINSVNIYWKIHEDDVGVASCRDFLMVSLIVSSIIENNNNENNSFSPFCIYVSIEKT